MSRSAQVLETVAALLENVRRLEALYPGRQFTLDGHLVGSIGEVLAAELYGLTLLPASAECHDACCPAGRDVQIKLTQGKRVAMYAEPAYLLVLRLSEGKLEEVYNGPGLAAWNVCGPMQKNGQRSVSVARLRRLMDDVPERDRLTARAPLPFFRTTA